MKKIGKIASTHGIHGEVIINHTIQNIDKLSETDALLIEVWEKSFIPFFIESISYNNHTIQVKFEEIKSREDAKSILNKSVYTIQEQIQTSNELLEWGYLLTFKVIDFSTNNEIGSVHDILENNMQHLLEIEYSNKFICIPIHKNLIQKIDKNAKTIYIEIAEGLLDLL